MYWSGLGLLNCNLLANKSTIQKTRRHAHRLSDGSVESHSLDDHGACFDWSPIPSASAGDRASWTNKASTWRHVTATLRVHEWEWGAFKDALGEYVWSSYFIEVPYVCGSRRTVRILTHLISPNGKSFWRQMYSSCIMYCTKIIDFPPMCHVVSLPFVKLLNGIQHTVISKRRHCWAFYT